MITRLNERKGGAYTRWLMHRQVRGPCDRRHGDERADHEAAPRKELAYYVVQ